MPKKSAKAEFNNFIGGLITEASPLNFPPNSSQDEVNFQLKRIGTRERRDGLGFKSGFAYRTIPFNFSFFVESAMRTFRWDNVGGDGSKNFLVVSHFAVLHIFDMNVANISATGYLTEIALSGIDGNGPLSFATVQGKLIIAGDSPNVAVVEYADGAFTQSNIKLSVRDFWGVSYSVTDNNSVTHPTSFVPAHIYNLYNQSWGISRKTTAAGGFVDPTDAYKTAFGYYPSDSEEVYVGLQYQANGTSPYEAISMNLFSESTNVGAKASKGHFIIDVLARGAGRSQAIANTYAEHPQMVLSTYVPPSDVTLGGASVVCEFAGRVFYAGFRGPVGGGDVRSPNLANHILFSQLVKNTLDLGKCYQAGDPTSREGFDVVDTDGGIIRISGSGSISHMVNLGTALIVFSDTGVWAVTGSGGGFSATNYEVNKICEFGILSTQSVVKDSSSVYFWASDGIYNISRNQFGEYGAQSVTNKSIQTYYDSIPTATKIKAQGQYDIAKKTVRWLYSDTSGFVSGSTTTELILDLNLGAFYKFQINNLPNTRAICPFKTTLRSADAGEVQYLALVSQGGPNPVYTFASYNNTQFRDWKEVDSVGLDASAYLITGAITAGDTTVNKQVPYLTMHFYRTELGTDSSLNPLTPSSCFVRSQWSFANSVYSNKWSSLFQAYRYLNVHYQQGIDDPYGTGFEVISTKNKLRGSGKALSIYMQTEPYKDCRIVGWSLTLNGNSIT